MSDYDHREDDSSRKRKAPSRGVASLTPDQLAKKRANDREAQRAIRERTKNTIDSLERRITELTSQQPYQELQEIVRQKDAALAENEEIRRRLASVVSILQPLLSGGLLQMDAKSQGYQDMDMQNVQVMGQSFGTDYMNMPRSIPAAIPTMPMQNSNSNTPVQTIPIQSNTSTGDGSSYPSPFPSSDHDSEAYWQPRILNTRDMQKTHELFENGDRLNFSFLMDTPQPRPPQQFTFDRRQTHSQPPDTNAPAAWKMLPKNCDQTCTLDGILLDFLKAGQPDTSPAYPSISNLLNPPSPKRPDPLSKLMTDIISTFPNISGMPEKVATTFSMFLFMRWQKYPSPDNYHRLPEWMTPRPSALFEPHPAWMDNIPWPRMRDRIIHDQKRYAFDDWFLPFTSGLSVNWTGPGDCLVFEGDEAVISPAFEAHIYRLDNWSVGSAFMKAYPELKGTCIVREPKRKDAN